MARKLEYVSLVHVMTARAAVCVTLRVYALRGSEDGLRSCDALVRRDRGRRVQIYGIAFAPTVHTETFRGFRPRYLADSESTAASTYATAAAYPSFGGCMQSTWPAVPATPTYNSARTASPSSAGL